MRKKFVSSLLTSSYLIPWEIVTTAVNLAICDVGKQKEKVSLIGKRYLQCSLCLVSHHRLEHRLLTSRLTNVFIHQKHTFCDIFDNVKVVTN